MKIQAIAQQTSPADPPKARAAEARRKMEAQSVFVGGVHGSGKSSFCQELAPYLGAHHVTASSLIASAKRLESGKATSGIANNQRLLVAEFRKIAKRYSSILLDGHFCLLNKSGQIEILPVQVFKELSIGKIVIIQSPPPLIYERLLNRDGSTHQLSISDIGSFQEAEIAHAQVVANTFHLPLLNVDPSEQANALDVIAEFVRTGDGSCS